jgi:hypothetical protein
MTTSLTSWLDGLSSVQLALVCRLFFIAITLVGIVLIHPLMRRLIHGERQANDVVIFVAANYGLIFVVLLGLLTVATFQTTKDLQDQVAAEASDLSTMYHSADGYPEPLRSQLKSELRDYTHYVIAKDWPAHRVGRVPQGGRASVAGDSRGSVLVRAEEQNPGSSSRRGHSSVQRHERFAGGAAEAVSSSMPAVLWYVVIFGGVLTIVFLWMIHMDFIPQIILGVLTAIFIGLMTFLIFAMDHPLQGAVSVGPRPFQSVYDLVMKWDEAS